MTDLTKKGVKWHWGDEEQRCFEELKSKLANVKSLGVPKSNGEIVMITDASDVGGGASIYQWQKLDSEELKSMDANHKVTEINKDGSLKHDYGDEHFLVPLGFFNWKWNSARKNYSTYEQEILSGILTLASQRRILSHLPIVWLCDQKLLCILLQQIPRKSLD